MARFEKTCGAFSLSVSDPSPSWIDIRKIDDSEARLAGFRLDELPDLKYLIDRALAVTEGDRWAKPRA